MYLCLLLLGDYLFYLYGGMQEYVPSPTNAFIFPAIWILVFAACAFVVLNYPLKDLNGSGQYVLVKAKSRSLWWLSKCGWNVISTLFYHFLLILTMVFCCIIVNVPVSLEIHVDLIKMMFELPQGMELNEKTVLPCIVLLTPVLFSVALNLFQMQLSFYIKPIYSYMIFLGILLSSAYFMTPYMIGNYAMPVRYHWILGSESDIFYKTGIVILAFIAIFSIIAGLVRIHDVDILAKE